MSGAISIPFAFLALCLSNVAAKTWFAVLAYLGMGVYAIATTRQNYKLKEQSGSKADGKGGGDDSKQRRKKILDKLGDYRLKLKERMCELDRMHPNAFAEQTELVSKPFDGSTENLLNEIYAFIESNVGSAAREDFTDLQHMDRTPIEGIGTNSIYHPHWQSAIWRVRHYEHNLKIISERIDHYAP
jgi:hypothetical protein